MEKERLQRILALSRPIIGGMVSQNLLNVVDTAMVGFLGDAALDALLAGESVTTEHIPSIGCSIKWKPGNTPSWFG